MTRSDDDKKAIVDSENTLKFMKDMERQVDARAAEVHKVMRPISTRLKLNHFTQEYDDLFRKGNRD